MKEFVFPEGRPQAIVWLPQLTLCHRISDIANTVRVLCTLFFLVIGSRLKCRER
jgi:hypothetical protein